MTSPHVGLSLFWRTVAFLALLLLIAMGALGALLQSMHAERETRGTAELMADTVALVAPALSGLDPVQRSARAKALGAGKPMRVLPRAPQEALEPFETDGRTRTAGKLLRQRTGADTVLARSVNGVPGLWLGFSVEQDRYWLHHAHGLPAAGLAASQWLWLGLLLACVGLGAAAVASLINQPLKELSFAASRIREGDLDSRLDENTLTSEIREVNKGFNRMARELAKVEEDRVVMLAGISHDLRTPLARLRLETEMSVNNDDAKRNMVIDIEQLDAIIDKFMDYARPGVTQLAPVHLAQLIDKEVAAFRDPREIRITSRMAIDVTVLADETELGRVFANLFENARRYGRNTYTGVANVAVTYVRTGPWVIVTVRDQGPGVPPEKLSQLTTPFFRGDAARTAATGAGLGLAIVEKALQRMGGSLELANAPEGGGLMAHIRLKRGP